MKSVPERAAKMNSLSSLDTGDPPHGNLSESQVTFELSPARIVTAVRCALVYHSTGAFLVHLPCGSLGADHHAEIRRRDRGMGEDPMEKCLRSTSAHFGIFCQTRSDSVSLWGDLTGGAAARGCSASRNVEPLGYS